MGYDLNMKVYKLINKERLKLIISHDVVFNENHFGSMNSNEVNLEKDVFEKNPKKSIMIKDGFCHDLSFRLTTKVKAWKGVGRKCNPRVTFACPGM